MQFCRSKIYGVRNAMLLFQSEQHFANRGLQCNCSRANKLSLCDNDICRSGDNLWREKRHAVVQENNILLTEVSNAIALESNLWSEKLHAVAQESNL